MPIINLVYEAHERKREPWSNTVMYYPFEKDQLDKVGSSSISVAGTKENLWYTFNSNWTMYLSNPPTNCRFISVLIKYNSANWAIAQWPTSYIWCMLYNFIHTVSSYSKAFQIQTWSSTWSLSSSQNTTNWVWYHMAFWYDGSNAQAYINWIKVWDVATSSYDAGIMYIWNQINETLSEYIWESVIWTETEITQYFNSIKDKYWIS